MVKRNAALEALGKVPEVPLRIVEDKPKAVDKYARVMLYLPPPIAHYFKQIALDQHRKPHDVFIDALQVYLRTNGHIRQADMLAQRHAGTAVR